MVGFLSRRTGTECYPESYGGHYGPVFNEYIESQNAKNIPGAHKIKLETVLIGNGWYNPLIQVLASDPTNIHSG